MLCAGAASMPLYNERLVAALPLGHPLGRSANVDWKALRSEVILVQGWDESQVSARVIRVLPRKRRGFPVACRKQAQSFRVWAPDLEFRVTTASQSEVAFPGVIFRPIDEPNASVQIALRAQHEDPVVDASLPYARRSALTVCLTCERPRNFAKRGSVAMKRARIGPTSFGLHVARALITLAARNLP